MPVSDHKLNNLKTHKLINLLIHFAPGILERYGAVEYEVLCGRLLVDVEVADAAELQVVERLGLGQVALHVAFGEHLQ